MAWQRRNETAPWLAPAAVSFLEQWLQGDERMVEFGSGRSTLWFAERVRSLISLEHDETWYRSVRSEIERRGANNVELHLVTATPDNYVRPVGADGAALSDLVLIDGVCRDHCAMWALANTKPGGLIIIDNAERYLPSRAKGPESIGEVSGLASIQWQTFWDSVGANRKVWFDCGIWSTLVIFI